jgi:membrane associated rhomboid family serine protease
MFFFPFGTREGTFKERFHYVTLLLFFINNAVFAWQILLYAAGGDTALSDFINRFAVTPSDVTDGSFLEIGLITSMFLHAGLLHLAGNMLYFLPFGDNVENRLGHVRYIIFYLACGIIATISYCIFNPHSNVPLLGASGAIAGVLGGYLALHPGGTVKGFAWIIIIIIRVDLPAVVFIGYWFILQVFSSIASLGGAAAEETGGVAFIAHVAGFIAGLILAPLLALRQKEIRPSLNTSHHI